jgi:dihydrofolate synthase / folylpolyglutamate synthase
MTYQETLDYLFTRLAVFQHQGATAYKPGLDNTLLLDEYFGYPHQRYKTIHVAGTNGKGSVSHFLAAILQSAGYKTGLYTSPHLKDFRERIRVNGEMISRKYVTGFVEQYRNAFEPINPSFFELTMEMAFLYFAQQKVDVAVIEVGLGGRLDSTNIITPELSIITNISFDHVQFLGDTLPKIAREKAGIIKPRVPVVIGEADGETRRVFEEKTSEMHAPVIFAQDNEESIPLASECKQLEIGLKGNYHQNNVLTVLNAVGQLRKKEFVISDNAIRNGLADVVKINGLQGRWQTLQLHPTVVCDTAHNEGGIRYVVKQLEEQHYNRLHIVFGMVNDKDITTVLSLLPKNAIYYFTQAAIPRALEAEKLRQMALTFGLQGPCYSSVKVAVETAKQAANEGDCIYIGGSTFVVAEAL